ncbi:hypothetical protein ACFL08_03845 [Patescibacteria group bacterium]
MPKNRKAVMEILETISPRIIGQRLPYKGSAQSTMVAFEIDPAGDDFPGREVLSPLWSVKVRCVESGEVEHIKGLNDFITENELNAIFGRYLNTLESNPYRVDVAGFSRVEGNLPAAVRIRDNDSQTNFCFDWGKDQGVAGAIHQLYMTGDDFSSDSYAYKKLINLMSLVEPAVYRGGPDPELPFESKWLLDYRGALGVCSIGNQYDYAFFKDVRTDKCIELYREIVFSKKIK